MTVATIYVQIWKAGTIDSRMKHESTRVVVVEKEVPGADRDLPLFRMKRFVWTRWSVKRLLSMCVCWTEKKSTNVEPTVLKYKYAATRQPLRSGWRITSLYLVSFDTSPHPSLLNELQSHLQSARGLAPPAANQEANSV